MDFSNRQTIVCYIDTNKILFYQGATGSILALEFPPEVLSYLDLLHEGKFVQLIELFLEQNKLEGNSVVLIYSSTAIFEKDFEQTQEGKEDAEIQKFIDMVPFEDVLSKIYKLNKKIKVVALNNRVYESIRTAFEKGKFLIYAVIPVSVLQETFSELAENIDLGFILSKIDSVKQYSMINGSVSSNPTLEKKPEAKKQNKRLYVLGGIFGILILILIVLVITSLSSNNSSKKTPGVIAPTLSPRPTILETSKNENLPPVTETSSTPSGIINQKP